MRLPHREAAAEKNEVFCMIIQNVLVYTPRHTFERGTLFIRNGRIVPSYYSIRQGCEKRKW